MAEHWLNRNKMWHGQNTSEHGIILVCSSVSQWKAFYGADGLTWAIHRSCQSTWSLTWVWAKQGTPGNVRKNVAGPVWYTMKIYIKIITNPLVVSFKKTNQPVGQEHHWTKYLSGSECYDTSACRSDFWHSHISFDMLYSLRRAFMFMNFSKPPKPIHH